jgi:alpha/beta superfamily hydrolase
VILGARDQFTSVDDMARYTAAIGATLHVIPESDHFFSFRAEQVAVLVAAETSRSGVES